LYNQPFPLSALIARTLMFLVIMNGQKTSDSIAEVTGYENEIYI